MLVDTGVLGQKPCTDLQLFIWNLYHKGR